ncbi:MAG: hypothetical protein QOJ81_59 [Chloroflexota bacterium]|jgi:hypothetical protein|nr:hypothetical protein [Chloroflexota bacterium]
MASRAAVARILSAILLFSGALLLMPARAVAVTGVITSPGPLSQIFISDTLGCQVAYAGDPGFEFFPSTSTEGDCGTFVALGASVWGPASTSAALTGFTTVSQTPVTGAGTLADPFRIVTVVTIPEAGLRITETDSYAVGSRAYRTDVEIANVGNAVQTGVTYRAGDCYLQGSDAGFVRVDGGSPSCIVDPALGRRVEQWLPITVGSHYFAGAYGEVWTRIDSQVLFPDTCACTEQFVFDNGAGISWPFNIGPGVSAVFSHETFFSPVGGSPTSGAAGSFRDSVPTQITLDPIVVAQSVAITAGVIVLVPFPSALFNNTLEENYAEVMGWLSRLSAALGRLWRRLRDAFRSQVANRRPLADASSLPPPSMAASGEMPPFLVASPPQLQAPPEARDRPVEQAAPAGQSEAQKDPWRSPLRIAGFVVLTALLYAFLDPTFGLSLDSLATFAGLAIGLFVVLLAYGLPLIILARKDGLPLTVRALPATLVIGVVCVLVSRFANFQPGYLYGLIIGFLFAHGVERRLEGRAEAIAAGASLLVALVAWIVLAFMRSAGSPPGDLGAGLLEAAAVTIVVAGLENAVFAMLPLRFMPGQAVYTWDRRVWAALMGLGLFGFAHVLLNPAEGSGYLADTTRTSFFTLILLLALFGISSVLFWAYFRFRPARAASPAD